MGKKRKQQDIDEVLARPWCYYCERDFDDLKILISHQKAKHFKCDRCGRRLNTAGGLSVHLNQVHKEQLNSVENSLPDREHLNVEIFGMEGIPEDIKQKHDKRVTEEFWQKQSDRRAATGNPPAGSKEALAVKPSKFEDEEALVARFKAHMLRVERGEPVGSSAMEGVQATPVVPIPMAVSPDQGQPFAAPPFQPPPMGFPGGPQFPGQPPFQAPFLGSPPFAQGPYQPPPVTSSLPQRPPFNPAVPNPSHFHPGTNGNASTVDDLISSAQAAAVPTQEVKAEKKGKADKGKADKVHLVYSDNEISPEEKMAMHSKYAFVKA